MTDWARKFRTARFRGVSFHVATDGASIGRRIVVHEVSGGEASVTEDMGPRTGRFPLTAYLAGEASVEEGLALELACGVPGPGSLILPMEPLQLVHCENCERSRTKDRNGYIAYTLDFVLAGNAAGAGAGFPSAQATMRNAFATGLSGVSSRLGVLL